MAQIVKADDLISALTDGGVPTLDALTSARTGGNAAVDYRHWHKEWRSGGAAATAAAIGYMESLWQFEGIPSHGVAPGAWANPTNATDGALKQADAGGGRSKWLTYACAAMNHAGILMVYDRLGHCSGLSGTTFGTPQNVNGGLLGGITRYTNGNNNHAFVEINTAIGTTATTITGSYQNQAGSAATFLATDIGAANHDEAGRLIPLSLAQGDKGVQGVTSATLAASTGTAGDFGIVIMHPLFMIPLASAATAYAVSFEDGPIAKILAGACISLALISGNSNSPPVDVFFEMCEA